MTYGVLALPFVGVAAAVLALAAALRRPDASWWRATGLTLAALLVLTAVFDNVMIAADLFTYDDEHTSGASIGLAPLEDFAWPVAAGLGLPALWLLVTGAGEA